MELNLEGSSGTWVPKEEHQEMELLCRVCANQNDYLIPIFEGEGLDHNMPSKINQHLPIKVTTSDKLPTQICFQCASTIIAFSDLVTGCLEANKKLSSMLKTSDKEGLMDDLGDENFEYEDLGVGAAEEDDEIDNDNESFEKEIKQLISDAGVDLPAASTSSTRGTRKRKTETATPKKTVTKRLKTVALLKPKKEEEEDPPAEEGSDDRWLLAADATLTTCIKKEDKTSDEPCSLSLTQVMEPDSLFCAYCSAEFLDKIKLKEHIKKHKRLYSNVKCPQCDITYLTSRGLAAHIIQKHSAITLTEDTQGNVNKPEVYACKDCNHTCKSQARLTVHRKLMHSLNQSVFFCFDCERTFEVQRDFVSHVKMCSKLFGDLIVKILLNKSQCPEKEELIYKCLGCTETFVNELAVKIHIAALHSDRACDYSVNVDSSDSVQCHLCNLELQKRSYLLVHMKYAHLCSSSQTCPFCESTFEEISFLWSHLFERHADCNLKCTLCDCLIVDLNYLMKHMLLSHSFVIKVPPINKQLGKQNRVVVNGKEKFACNACPSVLYSLATLKRHILLTHSDATPYVCDRCHKGFKTKTKLSIHHNSVHERIRSYVCGVCDKSFAISSNLTKHVRIHTGEKPYSCNQCGMSFAQSSSLYSHKLTHQQNFSYTCTMCGKAFLRAFQLKNHERKHSLSPVCKPFSCETCGKAFRANHELKRHQTIHTTLRSFRCELCDASFTLKKYLVQHCKTLH